jgi:hypothetical protein
MTIKDIFGNTITVTDLKAAIMQTEANVGYSEEANVNFDEYYFENSTDANGKPFKSKRTVKNGKTVRSLEFYQFQLNQLLELQKQELIQGIEAELRQNHPEHKIIFDDDFVFTGKPVTQWGGDHDQYNGVKYYFARPSPSHKGDPLLLIWTFKREEN